MTKSLTLREMLPEINVSQWHYLYSVIDSELDLTFVQREAFEQLLGFRIQL